MFLISLCSFLLTGWVCQWLRGKSVKQLMTAEYSYMKTKYEIADRQVEMLRDNLRAYTRGAKATAEVSVDARVPEYEVSVAEFEKEMGL